MSFRRILVTRVCKEKSIKLFKLPITALKQISDININNLHATKSTC
jgi:hypothetical protein